MIASSSRLAFDEASHVYYLDSKRVPSVTQCLESVGMVDKEWYKEEHAERGNWVHKASVLVEENDLDWDTVPEEYAPYLHAFEAFLRETDWKSDMVEQSVFSLPYRYAGTLDRTGHLNKWPCILDLKTGSLPSWVGAQLSGYKQALKDMGDDTPYKRYALQLKKDGRYKLEECKDHSDHSVFLSAVTVTHWLLANGRGV